MAVCTTQWAGTVNSANHSSTKTLAEKLQTQKFVNVSCALAFMAKYTGPTKFLRRGLI
jgi:hypothetical protein